MIQLLIELQFEIITAANNQCDVDNLQQVKWLGLGLTFLRLFLVHWRCSGLFERTIFFGFL